MKLRVGFEHVDNKKKLFFEKKTANRKNLFSLLFPSAIHMLEVHQNKGSSKNVSSMNYQWKNMYIKLEILPFTRDEKMKGKFIKKFVWLSKRRNINVIDTCV